MPAKLPRLQDADIGERRVLVRADLNVPLDASGGVADDYRIRAALPTLEHLLDRGARVVVCSHLGRPKGRDTKYSVRPVAEALSGHLGRQVRTIDEVAGPVARVTAEALQPGEVLMVENLRFEPGETKNDAAFATALSELADVYVNDAFGASHRAHASIVGVAERLPAYAGYLLQEEIQTLSRFLEDPPRPFVVVLGGAKVSDKLGVVRNLLDRAERILIGGGMCFTFLKARGAEVGRSLVDEDRLDEVRSVLEDDIESSRILLPFDVVVGDSPDAAAGDLAPTTDIPADAMGLDIGPATAETFAKEINQAASLFWNGPLGVFENEPFSGGTRAVAMALAASDCYSVIGGGDTVAALASFGLLDEVDFVSTGGGASLELLEGRRLPGVEALERAAARKT